MLAPHTRTHRPIMLVFARFYFFAVLSCTFGYTSAISYTDVFVSVNAGGQEYPPCYRQPVLLSVNLSTLLAFSTGRNKTGASKTLCSDPGDGSPNYICLKRSKDNGKTFQPIQILFGGSGNMQPDFYIVYYEKESLSVVVIFQTKKSLFSMRSQDEGSTWSRPEPFTVKYDEAVFESVGPSVGKGISDLGNGTILLPFICSSYSDKSSLQGDKGACPMCHSCSVRYDRETSSWNVAAIAMSGTRESQLAAFSMTEKDRSTLIVSTERNMGKRPGHRFEAFSNDTGRSFFNQHLTNVPEPSTKNWTGIKSGLSIHNNKVLIQSHPNSTRIRKDLVLSVSKDRGKSWEVGKFLIFRGPSGYSDLTMVNKSHIGVLFERGTRAYADKISLVLFDGRAL